MYRKILVPTDGSDLAMVAAEAAIAFARTCGSDIVALAVVQPEPPVTAGEGAMATAGELYVDVLQEQAQQHVAMVGAAAARAGVKCTGLTVYGYSPADEIIEAARRNDCDLIFIASHGRRGLGRLIAGSVTQRVLAYAPVPVMVYRAPRADAAERRHDGRQAHAPGAPATV